MAWVLFLTAIAIRVLLGFVYTWVLVGGDKKWDKHWEEKYEKEGDPHAAAQPA